MKPFPPAHPLSRCHFKGPSIAPIAPPPTVQPTNGADAAEAARKAAAKRNGIQSTIIGGASKPAESGNQLLGGGMING